MFFLSWKIKNVILKSGMIGAFIGAVSGLFNMSHIFILAYSGFLTIPIYSSFRSAFYFMDFPKMLFILTCTGIYFGIGIIIGFVIKWYRK